jgi:hypothetical protein
MVARRHRKRKAACPSRAILTFMELLHAVR